MYLKKLTSMSMMVLLTSAYGSTSFGMDEYERPVDSPHHSVNHTYNDHDTFSKEANTLKEDLRAAIAMDERYEQCASTELVAKFIISVLKDQTTTPTYLFQKVSSFCEPGAGMRRHDRPKNVQLVGHAYIKYLFEEQGLQVPNSALFYEDPELFLLAHKHKVNLCIDPETDKRIPLQLTYKDLTNYQLFYDFKKALHNFYNGFAELLNKQLHSHGKTATHKTLPPMEALESPVISPDIKLQVIENAKKELAALDKKKAEEEAVAAAERRTRYPYYGNNRTFKNHRNNEEHVQDSAKRIAERQEQLKAELKHLSEQQKKLESRIAQNEDENFLREIEEQQLALQYYEDEKLARQLARELNG